MVKNIIIVSFMIFFVFLDFKFNIINIPDGNENINRQINYITIGAIFAGFSFTTLGLLIGMSSEELIENIKETDIIIRKIRRLSITILWFMVSAIISIFFILGLNNLNLFNESNLNLINHALYIIGIETFIMGIIYFIASVIDIYKLVIHIYKFNKKKNKIDISLMREQIEKNKWQPGKGD